jgi:hypothetical protein
MMLFSDRTYSFAFLLLLLLVLLLPAAATAARFQTRLTADVGDVSVSFGLVLPQANTVQEDAALRAPPGAYDQGTMVVAMLPSLQAKTAEYEVYTVNSTGSIPYFLRANATASSSGAPQEEEEGEEGEGAQQGMCLYRWTTADFKSYGGGKNCLLWVGKSGLSDIKTLARDDDTGKYYLLYWSLHGIGRLYTSTTAGQKWVGPRTVSFAKPPKATNLHPKDDINFVWQKGVGLVNMQIFWERNLPATPGGYCDNGGCDSRRVIGSMTTTDGVDAGLSWSYTGSHRFPSAAEQDPPELQFYRIRPFVMPGTQGARVFAHTLLYAPSPWINKEYGRQPSLCQSGADAHNCHGPHMYEEWWTLKRGASPADVTAKSWRRPARFTKMAPENAYLFAQPGVTGTGAATKMAWVGSGAVYTLPLHRGVGIYAPANARVKVQPAFNLEGATPHTQLFLNADAKWGAKLPAGGCDETCAAYVLAELLDGQGKTIKGYDHKSFDAIMDQDGINLPLTWNGSARLPTNQKSIVVKLWFRAAKVYAVYLGDQFEPGT